MRLRDRIKKRRVEATTPIKAVTKKPIRKKPIHKFLVSFNYYINQHKSGYGTVDKVVSGCSNQIVATRHNVLPLTDKLIDGINSNVAKSQNSDVKDVTTVIIAISKVK
jgi:hypothetical protein